MEHNLWVVLLLVNLGVCYYNQSMAYTNWVCVEEARGQLEGEIIKASLEASGIPVQTFQESAGIVYGLTVGSLGLVKIWVPEEFETQAKEVLASADRGDFQASE